jgi:hypothetical protein
MNEAHWFFRRGDRQVGPLTRGELAALCAMACVAPSDEVSNDGENWMTADTVRDFAFGTGEPASSALNYHVPQPVASPISENACSMLRRTVPFLRIAVWLFLLPDVLAASIGLVLIRKGLFEGDAQYIGNGLAWLVVAVLYLPPVVYLSRYSSYTKTFLWLRQAAALEAAFTAQKSFWKYVVISSFITLGLYILIVIIIVAAMLVARI